MKYLIPFILLLLAARLSVAQTQIDVVHLNNGSVLRGVILEEYPDSILKLKMADGNFLVFQFSEIQKITRDTVQKSTEGFQLNSSYKKITYKGTRVHNMKWKELKSILYTAKDDQINSLISKVNTKRAISTTGVLIGTVLIALGTINTMAAANSGTSDGSGGGGLLVAGGIVMLTGAIAGSGGKQLTRLMMERYNAVNGFGNTISTIGIAPVFINNDVGVGISFTKTF